jgi:hypothetical protein
VTLIFATMDPSNKVLLIVMIVALVIERTITLCEWGNRQRQQRKYQTTAARSELPPGDDLQCEEEAEIGFQKLPHSVGEFK